nr:peroxidase 5 [Quercus suber]
MEHVSKLYLDNTAITKLPTSIGNLTGLSSLNKSLPRDSPNFQDNRYEIVFPGSEILEWFSHQCTGNEVNIMEPSSHLCNEWIGIAVCVVFCSYPHRQINSGYSVCCKLTVNGERISFELGFLENVVSDHICLNYFLPQFYKKKNRKSLWKCDANGFYKIGIQIVGICSSLVKKCGLRVVYKKDIKDLNKTMAQCSNNNIIPYKGLDIPRHYFDNSAKQSTIFSLDNLVVMHQCSLIPLHQTRQRKILLQITQVYEARDSVELTGGLGYDVPAGRRNGKISLASDTLTNLPPPSFNVDQLTKFFSNKGFTQEEMVTLSGAHTIGRSHCTSFSNRLYNFNGTTGQDPSLDPMYASRLKQQCPQGNTNPNLVVPMDPSSPAITDAGYYTNILANRGLFTSDQTLMTNAATANQVNQNARSTMLWRSKFAAAMVKMGQLDVLTGNGGEIRSNCRMINS